MHFSLPTIRVWARNVWRARVRGATALAPLGVTWHATHACNFNCAYCDDGRGNRYPDLRRGAVMTTDEVKRALSLAREQVAMLYITGGEPLLRSDLGEIVRWAKEDAGFCYVGLATNGVLLRRQESLLSHLDDLEISLDSLDLEYYDRLLGGRAGVAAAVQEAVIRYHGLAAVHGYRFSVTCVAMPGRLQDARSVLEFCADRGIAYSVLPLSKGPYPDADLKQDPAWAPFIDDLVARKRRGEPVFGSYVYFDHIRNFRKFQCYPTLVPRITPGGELCYPCSPLGTTAGSLLDARSFAEVLEAGRAKHGPIPSCDARCFASCYIETSSCISVPLALFLEHADAQTWRPLARAWAFFGRRGSRASG